MARKPAREVEKQVHDEAERRALQTSALLEILGNSRRLLWVNFVAGLGRGIGFFLGVTLVGALLIGLTAGMFDRTAAALGFKHLTLAAAMRATIVRFEELRQEVDQTQAELAAKQAELAEQTGQAPSTDEPPKH